MVLREHDGVEDRFNVAVIKYRARSGKNSDAQTVVRHLHEN